MLSMKLRNIGATVSILDKISALLPEGDGLPQERYPEGALGLQGVWPGPETITRGTVPSCEEQIDETTTRE